MAKLYVAADTAFINPFGHLQIVYEDEAGAQFETELNGPRNPTLSEILGSIGLSRFDGVNWQLFFDKSHNANPAGENYGKYELILKDGQSAAHVWQLLCQVHSSLQSYEIEYNLFSQNSNSYIKTLLDVIGNSVDWSTQFVNDGLRSFPGYNRNVLETGLSLTVAGTDGHDIINGGSGADTIGGAGGNDTLYGGAGNDILTGGTGRDLFWGTASDLNEDTISDLSSGDRIGVSGGEIDPNTIRMNGGTLSFAVISQGQSSSPQTVSITASLPAGMVLQVLNEQLDGGGSILEVVEASEPDTELPVIPGPPVIAAPEPPVVSQPEPQVPFNLTNLTDLQQVAAIYIGYYNRAADPVGIDFWKDSLSTISLKDIAQDFGTRQEETQVLYPFLANPTTAQAIDFVTDVYENLFNRIPDREGLEFWAESLRNGINGEPGGVPVGQIIHAIIEGAQGADKDIVMNKINVALTWTNTAREAGYNGENDYAAGSALHLSAISIIKDVDDAKNTVIRAIDHIKEFFEQDPVITVPEIIEILLDRFSGFTSNLSQSVQFTESNLMIASETVTPVQKTDMNLAEILTDENALGFVTTSGTPAKISDGGAMSIAVNASVGDILFHSPSENLNFNDGKHAVAVVNPFEENQNGQSNAELNEYLMNNGSCDCQYIVFSADVTDTFAFI